MKIATVLNAHKPDEVLADTLSSIMFYMTDEILLVIDGTKWNEFEAVSLPVSKIKGFSHGIPRSPYRNVALGLSTIFQKCPDADWYCYCEPDVLFGSDRFKVNLEIAAEKNVWMLGSDGRVDHQRMHLIESLIGEPLKSCYYMIGCCQFFNAKFMQKLNEIDFFDKFLNATNNFSVGQFPHYAGYDISEHLYPSLARHYGGNLGVFATWGGNKWHGDGIHYPVRWKPELDDCDYEEACIMHPLKEINHPARVHHKNIRNLVRNKKREENRWK